MTILEHVIKMTYNPTIKAIYLREDLWGLFQLDLLGRVTKSNTYDIYGAYGIVKLYKRRLYERSKKTYE